MAKPIYAVVMDTCGIASVVKSADVQVKTKGTSKVRATRIQEELNNA